MSIHLGPFSGLPSSQAHPMVGFFASQFPPLKIFLLFVLTSMLRKVECIHTNTTHKHEGIEMKATIIAAVLISLVPVAAHADNCVGLGQFVAAAAMARDGGMSETTSLQIAGDSFTDLKALDAATKLIHMIYTDPGFIAMKPARMQREFVRVCHQG